MSVTTHYRRRTKRTHGQDEAMFVPIIGLDTDLRLAADMYNTEFCDWLIFVMLSSNLLMSIPQRGRPRRVRVRPRHDGRGPAHRGRPVSRVC